MLILQLVRLIRKARARKRVGLALVALLLGVALAGNAACFYLFDGPDNPDIGVGDALWYSVVSITTMGYGDFFARSTGARAGTIVFIVLLGLGAFSVFLSMLIDWTTTFRTMTQRGLGKAMAKNHVIIVHFPHRRRIQQIIDAVNRGSASHTSIRGLTPEAGDVVVYVAERRLRWPELLAHVGQG